MKVIVVGLGRMGTGLSLHLAKKGHHVTVIDQNPESFEHLGKNFGGAKILGFGFDREVLQNAKIDKVDAVVACTNSDEINAVIARVAKNIYHVPKVIARLYDTRKAEIYRRLGIQTISTTAWGLERASEILTYNQLDSIYDMGGGKVNFVRIEVPALLAGHTVQEISVMGEINIVTLSRGNKAFIPSLGTVLELEDILYMAVHHTATDKIKSIFGLL